MDEVDALAWAIPAAALEMRKTAWNHQHHLFYDRGNSAPLFGDRNDTITVKDGQKHNAGGEWGSDFTGVPGSLLNVRWNAHDPGNDASMDSLWGF